MAVLTRKPGVIGGSGQSVSQTIQCSDTATSRIYETVAVYDFPFFKGKKVN